ncbi:glycosyltransferase family 4 protein [Paraliobacillus ryukyuensis]|uniref:glycosyltransferase family 4 protein n=1 Tax=Paraliobacillus ryukyuensis TaxID=200904 RepID=UPI0009A70F87|nr:glycosyltransferase family 4 protein [Paraliobacillus ryukyuensis]
MKKITFVINYFYPDLASTGQLLTDLCRDLQDEFKITVIAAQPGYAGEKLNSKKLFEVDYLEKIKVIRVKLPSVNKASKISRIKYIMSYFGLALVALLREKGTSIIYTISQPPILGGLLGTLGKLIKRSKHVYNIQDFNPEQAAAINYTGNTIVYKLAKLVDKINCMYADRVIVVGNDMVETLKNRFRGNELPQYSVINNWTNEKEIVPLSDNTKEIIDFKKKYNLLDKFIIMYSGNIGLYYDLENIITIANHFSDNKNISFVFIGDGAVKNKMKKYTTENNLNNVLFLPYQDKDFIKYSLNVADIHLVVNQKGIKGVSVPSKVYGVMAAGKPILGVLEHGSEAQKLISYSKSGTVIEPHNYKGIINAINNFFEMSSDDLKQTGMSGRKYLEKYLRKEISIGKYRELLKKI